MKKLMIVAMIFVMSAFAFEMKTFGLKGGLNMANAYGDDVEDNVMAMTYAVGGYGVFGINEMFDFQPELLWTVKGMDIDVSGVDAGVRLSYIEVPLLAKINFMQEAEFKPFFLLGPALAMNVSAVAFVDDDEADIEDVKAMDLGVVIGAGMVFKQFTFDARYNLGMMTIDDSDAEADVKTATIQVMVGYSFK